MKHFGLPPKEGLYDPRLEHDACGIGFVANLHRASHQIVLDGIHILERLTHRGAAGADPDSNEGWVMSYVHNDALTQTEFVIVDASNFDGEPTARIKLPQRVPYGFHGSWIGDA